ncbi:hypothetical protein QJS10_CPB11g01257 [Acorus calamus]|uniref:Uncharacterized protein n=1 Tax=Acorus calamus TaxID=4465 RepID=A0AAV9DS27_ACOCL|nr:hypothetical protein QJS10_CPB11g01257 [Acorus calamus]
MMHSPLSASLSWNTTHTVGDDSINAVVLVVKPPHIDMLGPFKLHSYDDIMSSSSSLLLRASRKQLDEEHLFKPHETKLIAEKLNMKAIQKRKMEERMIMSKDKSKLLEVAEGRQGKKKKEEEEEEKRGEGGESKEMLIKELIKHNN